MLHVAMLQPSYLATKLWDEISEVKFYICKVAESFSPSAVLSDLVLNIHQGRHMELKDIVRFDPKILTDSVEEEDPRTAAVKRLNMVLNDKIELDVTDQCQIQAKFLDKVLSPLSKQIYIDRKVATRCEGYKFMRVVNPIGLGEAHTWHGIPDARVRGGSPFEDEMDVIYCPPSQSDGGTGNFKRNIQDKKKSQTVGTCVLSSFTDHSNHPNLNPMVPSALISCKTIIVCCYDCVKDVLLVSEEVQLLEDSNLFKLSTLMFMWLFINHR